MKIADYAIEGDLKKVIPEIIQSLGFGRRDSRELKVKYLLNSAGTGEYGAKKLLVDGIISDRPEF